MNEMTRTAYLHSLYVAASKLIDLKEVGTGLYHEINQARTALLFMQEPSGLDELLVRADQRTRRAPDSREPVLAA